MRFWFIFLLCFAGYDLFAQQKTLSGSVYDDATHLPLEQVTVHLMPGNHVSVTNVNGRYVFRNVPAKIDSISFSVVGYRRLALAGSAHILFCY